MLYVNYFIKFHDSMREMRASLVARMVKSLPAVWETQFLSLGWEDLLEKEWRPTPVFWPGEVHGLKSMGSQRAGHN